MISVIIPTLNEAARLPALLAALDAQTAAHEVIVVDGGSRDGTLEAARHGGARALASEPGRGQQLAAGAQTARGEVLLFLHADSQLAPGALAAVERAFARQPSLIGGNFRVIFDGASGFARWLTGFYAWFRRHGLYYGDSAIFLSAAAYRALGGIKPIALMEDYDLSRRMERAGATCCIAEPALVTSSRRFQGRHPVAIFCGWLLVHGLFAIGVPPALLARLYDSRRRRAGAPSPPPQEASSL
ncbi:MAG: TIGR04283 family arsenosugar biosynthesis glycosyltransferase [Pseudomonadota bacterium]